MLERNLMLLGGFLVIAGMLSSRYKVTTTRRDVVFTYKDVRYILVLTSSVGPRGAVLDTDLKRADNNPTALPGELNVLEQHIQQTISTLSNESKIHSELRYISQLCDLDVKLEG
jgi:hypothetical protein